MHLRAKVAERIAQLHLEVAADRERSRQTYLGCVKRGELLRPPAAEEQARGLAPGPDEEAGLPPPGGLVAR